jgi:hypothetical protein
MYHLHSGNLRARLTNPMVALVRAYRQMIRRFTIVSRARLYRNHWGYSPARAMRHTDRDRVWKRAEEED